VSTELFRLTDALDPEYKLTVETGLSGMKLFIYRTSADDRNPTGSAKFWFKSKTDVEDLIQALDWIKEHHWPPGSPL